MDINQPWQEASMRDEAGAFALWLKSELRLRYNEPKDTPQDLLQLVDRACTRA